LRRESVRLKPVRRLDNETQRDIAIKKSAATALEKPAYRTLVSGCKLRNVPIEKPRMPNTKPKTKVVRVASAIIPPRI